MKIIPHRVGQNMLEQVQTKWRKTHVDHGVGQRVRTGTGIHVCTIPMKRITMTALRKQISTVFINQIIDLLMKSFF